MRKLAVLSVCVLAVGAAPIFGAATPETPHLTFVTEYIRELATLEKIRADGEKELAEGKPEDLFSTAIHSSALFKLELRAAAAMLKTMRLNPPFETVLPNIIGFYEHKVALHQRLIEIATVFIAGQKPGVDYGKLAAELPQVRAQLDYIDHALFDVTPLVFAALIDQKPDSKNHLSHLSITKEERAKLIKDLNADFGSKLDEKEQKWGVSSASVLRTYLLKDYKCSDEPWE